MDKDASEKFISILIDQRATNNFMPLAGALTLLGQVASDTKKRRGKRGSNAILTICVTTQKKLCKLYNVVVRKPQFLTDARLKACLCPLDYPTFGVAS